ncbi:MAG: adenosine-specific kinase [Candidatus Nitrosocaldus sp.]|nr:adenosine-specific kinase [Candidatus Nitrosocaldus sp.]MDW8275203.1 adenosine-specific kinase [Candidatus Nitrosocaldus sp.]
MQLSSVRLEVPPNMNMILGQAHFIKTVEDMYEALVSSSPGIRFGIAFCEASGKALIRYDGNDDALVRKAVEFASMISAGHVFVLLIGNAYPINILNRVKMLDEVACIYCATANPVEVIVVETEQGRGILGVVDGTRSKGVEGSEDKRERHELLRRLGYKR